MTSSATGVDTATANPPWVQGPDHVSLEPLQAHVWAAELERDDVSPNRFLGLLSADERVRANQFRFARDRDRFVVARGVLRTLLERYLGLDASTLVFEYGSQGKPRLVRPSAARNVQFNLAHSGGLAVYAFSRDWPVGIDVERVRALDDLPNVAERFLSPPEHQSILALPENHRPRAFFECWTRKEAYLKALGCGLTAEGISPQPFVTAVAGWSLHRLVPATGYVGALAVAGPPEGVTSWTWPAGTESRSGAGGIG